VPTELKQIFADVLADEPWFPDAVETAVARARRDRRRVRAAGMASLLAAAAVVVGFLNSGGSGTMPGPPPPARPVSPELSNPPTPLLSGTALPGSVPAGKGTKSLPPYLPGLRTRIGPEGGTWTLASTSAWTRAGAFAWSTQARDQVVESLAKVIPAGLWQGGLSVFPETAAHTASVKDADPLVAALDEGPLDWAVTRGGDQEGNSGIWAELWREHPRVWESCGKGELDCQIQEKGGVRVVSYHLTVRDPVTGADVDSWWARAVAANGLMGIAISGPLIPGDVAGAPVRTHSLLDRDGVTGLARTMVQLPSTAH